MLEDETKKFYISTETELFIFQEDKKKQLRFIDYIYDSKESASKNQKGKHLSDEILVKKIILREFNNY